MSDPGAVERNIVLNDIALQRASQRNGGQVPPNPSPSDTITGATYTPSRAVDVPVRKVTQDAGISWGRSGQTETARERGAETMPELGGAAGVHPQPIPGGVSPTPEPLGRPVTPSSGTGGHGNMNMSDIANFKIGG